MKIEITIETVEFLLDHVVSITDPLLDFLHRAERRIIDDKCNETFIYLDRYELERLREVVLYLLNDDQTIPKDLARLIRLCKK